MKHLSFQKSGLYLTWTIAFIITIVLFSCESQENLRELPPLTDKELIKRGEYIINMGACHDCHSPKIMTEKGPVPDPERLLSGHPKDEKLPAINGPQEWVLFSGGATSYVGPWGQSFAANLTPDDTGIGNWSFDNFKRALRQGKYKGIEGGRDLAPPMPWQFYRHISDDDLYALFAYLKSLPPVDNLVPAYISPDKLAKNSKKQ